MPCLTKHVLRAQGDKPALYLQSTVHAREWLATTSLLWTAKKLAEGYGNDTVLTAVLDELDVFVVPLVNVDGFKYTHDRDRLWRKNRRDNGDGARAPRFFEQTLA